jgi:hypothetical protein
VAEERKDIVLVEASYYEHLARRWARIRKTKLVKMQLAISTIVYSPVKKICRWLLTRLLFPVAVLVHNIGVHKLGKNDFTHL